MPSALVGLLQDALTDLDRVVAVAEPAELIVKPTRGSSIAWSVGHVTNQLDGWINVQFAGRPAHPLIGDRLFRDGDGRAHDWPGLRVAVEQVRVAALAYLEPLSEAELLRTIPYDGSINELHEDGISLRYALLRIAAHHWVHVGEIAGYLGSRGLTVPPLPGHLTELLAATPPGDELRLRA